MKIHIFCLLTFLTLFYYVWLNWAISVLVRVGGWVGEIKNNGQLSPAEAETRAELGKLIIIQLID